MKCSMVIDWTCHPVTGDADKEIECDGVAEWRSGSTYACSDCYADHDETDRAAFTYIDPPVVAAQSESVAGKP